ncbi:hypothetical protein [Pseudomonas rubra]|uniref:Uncharacterized protein n=1 Tax=Pseudomonas rubra TaxID=2942627 RepID=A0ABT5PC51_9PSED|nr:hypothetical protein [Pseudomonas rubra]MDD1015881.1 hypothetical protein [Pseudomonas rubra]MDD1040216.1 hypothetical protein [Pseudomonas rubra]MDD1157909.1 hypothetical protein [Pseudomonas rubra]
MTSFDLLSRVWGETRDVMPKDAGKPSARRLQAVVAKLATAAHKRGLEGQLRARPAPQVDSPQAQRYLETRETVAAVQAGTYAGNPLPARAALLEINPNGTPRLGPQAPKALAWVLDSDTFGGDEYIVGDGSDGRLYKLFESDKVPAEDELPFASAVTGSGLLEPESPNPYGRLSWIIGIAAALVFTLGAVTSIATGHVMNTAKSQISASLPGAQYSLLNRLVEVCVNDAAAFPAAQPSQVCSRVLEDGKPPALINNKRVWNNPQTALGLLADQDRCKAPGCDALWRAALIAEPATPDYFKTLSTYLGSVDTLTGAISIRLPFLMLMAGLGGLVIALGLGTKQRVAGIWIDSRNRVSLARAQVTLWTVVVLSGYAALALFNIGFADLHADQVLNLFPQMPNPIAAALGIAIVTPMLSALILPTKIPKTKGLELDIADASTDLRKRGAPFLGAQSLGLDMNASPQQASITDLFMGEEKPDADTVDIARLQNVVITVVLVLGYFTLLLKMTSSISAVTLLGANQAVFGTLPNPDATFTSLLLVSHATYLVAKAYDSRAPSAKPDVAD